MRISSSGQNASLDKKIGIPVPWAGISAGRKKVLGISKEGSRLLRWALVETAWRLVRHSRRWQNAYEQLLKRCGKKRAIVAIARRLLGVMVALLRSGQAYRLTG